MPGASQLLRCCKPCRATTDNGDALSSLQRRNLWCHPSFSPRTINNRYFNLFDVHRVLVNSKHACGFARSRTEAACEFRKVVCGMKSFNGILPMLAIHQVIPVRNEVAERASVIAKRDTAVHATSSLTLENLTIKRFVDLFPVLQTKFDWTTRWSAATPL